MDLLDRAAVAVVQIEQHALQALLDLLGLRTQIERLGRIDAAHVRVDDALAQLVVRVVEADVLLQEVDDQLGNAFTGELGRLAHGSGRRGRQGEHHRDRSPAGGELNLSQFHDLA